jgi:hypothetical protein
MDRLNGHILLQIVNKILIKMSSIRVKIYSLRINSMAIIYIIANKEIVKSKVAIKAISDTGIIKAKLTNKAISDTDTTRVKVAIITRAKKYINNFIIFLIIIPTITTIKITNFTKIIFKKL